MFGGHFCMNMCLPTMMANYPPRPRQWRKTVFPGVS